MHFYVDYIQRVLIIYFTLLLYIKFTFNNKENVW